jgi:DNA-binding MarR family transcriptional regulator
MALSKRAKLTWKQAEHVWRMSNEELRSQPYIAKHFKISQSCVSMILRGLTYKGSQNYKRGTA